jgi:hypothetical protein
MCLITLTSKVDLDRAVRLRCILTETEESDTPPVKSDQSVLLKFGLRNHSVSQTVEFSLKLDERRGVENNNLL